jgi:hypothetical protein
MWSTLEVHVKYITCFSEVFMSKEEHEQSKMGFQLHLKYIISIGLSINAWNADDTNVIDLWRTLLEKLIYHPNFSLLYAMKEVTSLPTRYLSVPRYYMLSSRSNAS